MYIGRPSPYVFDLTMKTMGLDKSEVVMVGDRVSTDVKGAKAYGIRSALLMAGEFDEPDFWLESVTDVLAVLES